MSPSDRAKERTREYMERRQAERRKNARAPLHEPEEVRREIGWNSEDRRQQRRRRN